MDGLDVLETFSVAKLKEDEGGLVSNRVDNSIDTTRFAVSGTLTRRFRSKISANLNGRYSTQTSRQGTSGARSDFSTWNLSLSFTYSFDSIHLW